MNNGDSPALAHGPLRPRLSTRPAIMRHTPITVRQQNDKVARDHVCALLLIHSPRAMTITAAPTATTMSSDEG
jgi:hypothetical protein